MLRPLFGSEGLVDGRGGRGPPPNPLPRREGESIRDAGTLRVPAPLAELGVFEYRTVRVIRLRDGRKQRGRSECSGRCRAEGVSDERGVDTAHSPTPRREGSQSEMWGRCASPRPWRNWMCLRGERCERFGRPMPREKRPERNAPASFVPRGCRWAWCGRSPPPTPSEAGGESIRDVGDAARPHAPGGVVVPAPRAVRGIRASIRGRRPAPSPLAGEGWGGGASARRSGVRVRPSPPTSPSRGRQSDMGEVR